MRILGILFCAVCLASASAAEAVADVDRLNVPSELRVVSYYPADAGWTRMWEPWRPERISADLQRLRGLNANAVRVVLPPGVGR